MTVLTSTGAVNLTSSTNWSPAQIPTSADDLVLGAHTLTLDADVTVNSITFGNTSSRLAISGTTRSVQATNGFEITAAPSAAVISTTLTTGMSVTLTGRWWSNGLTHNFGSGFAASTGGNLTLQTVGSDASAILFSNTSSPNAAARVFIASWTAGTFTTIGRIDGGNWQHSSTIVTMSGGTWSHTNTGTSYIGNGGHLLASMSSTAAFVWNGTIVSQSNNSGPLINITGTGNHSFTGMIKRIVAGANVTIGGGTLAPIVQWASNGTLTITGQLCSLKTARTVAIDARSGSPGRINWRSQSVSIASTDAIIILNCGTNIVDMTSLVVSNAGVFTYVECGSATSVVDGTTSITNTTTSAQASVTSASGALDGKVVNLASTILRIPAANEVAAGSGNYGYTATPITPTGLVSDPATIATAVGTALDNISVTALRRWVQVDTGLTAASAGSVASLSGGEVDLTPVLEAIALLEAASSTWTDTEKAQIRYRLGLDGTATAPTGSSVDPIVVTPATGIMTTGYLVTRVKGVPTAGITIRYQQAQEPTGDRGSSYDDTIYSEVSNSEGIAELPLVKGGLYYVWRSAASRPMNVAAYRVLKADGTAPDATLALPSHVGA